MHAFASTPFRYLGKDYPYGQQDIADDTLARTLVSLGYVIDTSIPGSGKGTSTPVTATLLSNVSATGAGPSVTWPGGSGQVTVTGTFGGTSAIFQTSADGGTTWVAAGVEGTIAAAGVFGFSFTGPTLVRMFLSGGSPSGVSAVATGTTP